MNQAARSISEIDRIIHEPGRLMIVALLFAVEQADFLYLHYETGLNKGTLSSHLTRLEKSGYVEITKTYRGKIPQTLLQLTSAGRRVFAEYRKQLKKGLQI